MVTEEKGGLLSHLPAISGLFMRYGFRNVTMDDVARELRKSKKTLYKFVKNREDLAKMVVKSLCDQDAKIIVGIRENSESAIDELVQINKYVSEQYKKMHPGMVFELHKYFPSAFEVFEQHRDTFVYQCVLENLERGIKEGLYRDNMNPKIIAKFHVQKIENVLETTEFAFEELHFELIRYHIRGIASEKGINYLIKKVKNNEIL